MFTLGPSPSDAESQKGNVYTFESEAEIRERGSLLRNKPDEAGLPPKAKPARRRRSLGSGELRLHRRAV